MSEHHDPAAPEEANVERLLRHAYDPEPIDPAFSARVRARLQSEIRRRWRPSRRLVLALAACLVVAAGSFLWKNRAPRPIVPDGGRVEEAPPTRPTMRPLEQLAVGASVRTGKAERRRVRLSDGTVLSLNENTEVSCPSPRRLTLTRGEVFVEVSPRPAGQQGSTFEVDAAGRSITALGTRFAVRADGQESRVLVTQGKVQVEGVKGVLHTGQQWTAREDRVVAAPRATHALCWLADVVSATEVPVVPPSAFAGGALIANTPDGQEHRLSLRKYHVDVVVEDGFARTTIDQTYFNHYSGRLEGTFYFPLPADASLSRLAMYVEGTLNEGGMVERDYGRAVYESIVRKMQDPALLEWVDGTTFKMRVFPLEGRQEKRIILCYTQKLPSLHGTQSYRFPAGHSLETVGQWSFQARLKGGETTTWHSPSHDLRAVRDQGDLLLTGQAKDARLDRDVVLHLTGTTETEGPAFAECEHEGQRYLMLRWRPTLPTASTAKTLRHWVFLAETSAERNAVLARTQAEIVRGLLTNAEHEDTFSVLAVSSRASSLTSAPLAVTPANVERVLSELERVPLIGALSMDSALQAAAERVKGERRAVIVHLGSAHTRIGERREEKLEALLPASVPYVGVAVGKGWSRSLMKRLAARSGGHVTQINPDEAVAWRAFDLLATLNAPRLLDVQVNGGELRFLSESTVAAQGEEVVAVARVAKGTTWPDLVVTGTLDGKPFRETVSPQKPRLQADYLVRYWGRLEVDRLLAEDAARNKEQIVKLSKELYVMSPYTSLLVLENEAMYRQFNVEQGRPEIWAAYVSPKKIPVVHEPLPGQSVAPTRLPEPQQGRRSVQEVSQTIVRRPTPWMLRNEWLLATWDDNRLGEYELFTVPLWTEEDKRITVTTTPRQPLNYFYALPGVENNRDRFVRPVLLPRLTTFNNGTSREPFLQSTFDNGVVGHLRIEGERGRRQRFLHPDGYLYLPDGGVVWDRELQQLADHKARLRTYRIGAPTLFQDMLLHAPGLNTTDADVQAILETEAQLDRPTVPGRCDARARELIERARPKGWRSVEVAASRGQPGFTFVIDDAGRYHWRRRTPAGLAEEVVCDGKTIWHLYPEIGLAARRVSSPWQRRAVYALAPSLLPSLDDLLLGADLTVIDERTVGVIAHTGDQDVHLVFDAAGAFVERRIVDKKTGRVVRSEKVSDNLRPAEAPSLKPDLKKLVVLPMPYRTWVEISRKIGVGAQLGYSTHKAEERLELLAAALAERPQEVAGIIKTFTDAGDDRPGFAVLLAAIGHLKSDVPTVTEEGAAEALELLTQRLARGSPDHFCRRLLELHELCRLADGRSVITARKRERLLSLLRNCDSLDLLWAVGQRYFTQVDSPVAPAELAVDVLEVLRQKCKGVQGLETMSRYEWAMALARVDRDRAEREMEALYVEEAAEGELPAVDLRFDQRLGAKCWPALARRVAAVWRPKGQSRHLLALAEQAMQRQQPALANELRRQAVEVVSDADRPEVLQGAALQLRRERRFDEALALVETLLTTKEHQKDAGLWRLASSLAQEADRRDRALRCLETALDLEWTQPPSQQDRQAVRSDYHTLLEHYLILAQAARRLGQSMPDGASRVMRLLGRWRELDPHADALKLAAQILWTMGEPEPAWDYLTMALGGEGATPAAWQGQATLLQGERQYELADRALAEASHLSPDNRELVRLRAQNATLAGRPAQAQSLLEGIGEALPPR